MGKKKKMKKLDASSANSSDRDCENCGRKGSETLMAYRADRFCSDACRKALGLDLKDGYRGRNAA